jgi:hypothetical protein
MRSKLTSSTSLSDYGATRCFTTNQTQGCVYQRESAATFGIAVPESAWFQGLHRSQPVRSTTAPRGGGERLLVCGTATSRWQPVASRFSLELRGRCRSPGKFLSILGPTSGQVLLADAEARHAHKLQYIVGPRLESITPTPR